MAKEPEPEVVEEAPKKKGGIKKLIIIIVAVVVLLAVALVAVLLLTAPSDGKHVQASAEEQSYPPIYETLQPITIKLADGETYLQVEIKLRMSDNESGEKLKEYMPDIRSDLLGMLAGKQPDDISTQEGMNKLADEMKVLINRDIKAKDGKGVKKVLFGSFLTQ